ncbi:acetate--CoA ligase family protein [Herbiconiux sp. CPCC 203407]|uniref:Acetate--CoA ligase family protein n=1 Tax=Herbiconiux oxytropis TaxID=2970915 RepID=A0AA41XGH9_9MICO|nr:acetate--CoA ligase family protein [Herbiconiux oxytropis]MCS5722849.1 acetate--CoA ligase family protein [Herbiconiux oxytropis]MCS5727779.1 acetate--CoA ligase family protein [Herbiconiux oxytropis]
MSGLRFFHDPASVAIIGASSDPEKIGGRPIRYLAENGYAGAVYPVNPQRTEIQGLEAYPSLDALPTVPEVAIVAVSGANAVAQVVRCAELGVKGCVIMASGFGETGDEQGLAWQREMLDAAARTGMRIVGPNSQGLATFSTGAVLSFSTLFTEQQPEDGAVAVVSQSGALCSVPYGLLREAGIGVRYAHATGNDIDVTAAEFAAEVVADPEVRLLLLYLEDISDLDSLAEVARTALARGVPVVALKGGRSEAGQKAAASHTGALATEEGVVDAFLAKHGIWRARSTRDLVAAAELYLRPRTPQGERLAIVSNSGAICVLAADAAAEEGLALAELTDTTRAALEAALPAFASVENPIDVTAALLTDSSLFGKVLPVLGDDGGVDACVVGIPVAGRGYDVDRFADDVARFEATSGLPVVMAVPQSAIARVFRDRGIVVFADESEAVRALAQYLRHHALMAAARSRALAPRAADRRLAEARTALNESEGLEFLARIGVPAVEHVLVRSPAEARAAIDRLGGGRVVIKGCSSEATHKSELGLVRVGVQAEDAEQVVAEMIATLAREGLADEGVIVARLVKGVHEAMLGARFDPVFGPVVLLGAGGIHVEALPDVQLLLPPFSEQDALDAIGRLRLSAVLAGVRGAPPVDLGAWATAAVALGEAMLDPDLAVHELDVNPLMLLPLGGDVQPAVRAVDAVVVRSR